MLLPLVLALGLASNQPAKVAAMGFEGVGVDAGLLDFLAEHLAQRVAHSGVSVITRKDLATVLGFERQKQLLGCSDNSSGCMAELAGALGVDFVLTGDVARLSKKRLSATVKLLEATTGRSLFSRELRASAEEQLVHQVEDAGDAVLTELLRWQEQRERARPVAPVPAPAASEVTASAPVFARRLNGLPAWPTFAGLAVGAGGAIFLVRARQGLAELTALANDPSRAADPLGRAATLVSEGKRDTVLGTVLTAAGAASLLAGLLWWWLEPSREVAVSVSLVPLANGPALGISGSFR